MIIYKDIFGKLEKANYSINRVLEEGLISEKTINDIDHGRFVNMSTIDTICEILKCEINDVIEFVPDSIKEK